MRDDLARLLDDFRRYGHSTAVVSYRGVRRRETSYGEIARLAGRFASMLAHRGIVKGDRVLIWAENSAEWIAAFHGCMLRGVLAVPLDAAGTADFAARVAADVNPSLAVGDAALVNQLPTGVARMAFEDWPGVLPVEEAGPVAGLSADTPLQILFTSGTTGDPKGIVLTHGNVLASFGPIEQASQSYLRYIGLVHPLRILHTLPLSHVFGQTMGLWIPHIYRAELHFENRLVAARIVETIRRERISILAAVPRVHALLKAHLEATLPGLTERLTEAENRRNRAATEGENAPKTTSGIMRKALTALRSWWHFRDVHRAFGLKFWALISGGGALPGQLERFWNTVGLVLVQGYGMTETTALITLNHPFHVAQGTIGKPLAGREVKLGPDGEVLVRGAAISTATWSGGALHARAGEWLATGDLALAEATGEMRFLGRKSEVIVTAAGFNLHPEDLEAAIEVQPGVVACAVVPMETPDGPEACAVLALRGQNGQGQAQAAKAIERANTGLAEFQRLRRWVVWPEPDLPRTSTGKVRRKMVAAQLAQIQAPAFTNGYRKLGNDRSGNGNGYANGSRLSVAGSDWLVSLVAQISGESASSIDDESLLTEDLHLDSLGRVQLAAAVEERMGLGEECGLLDHVQTVGELRRLASLGPDVKLPNTEAFVSLDSSRDSLGMIEARETEMAGEQGMPSATMRSIYPHWPWSLPIRWIRVGFIEAVMRPLVWLLSNPKVAGCGAIGGSEPMLIVANHVSSFDGALLEYALPAAMRRRIAAAMSGEMLEAYRHFRNANRPASQRGLFLPGPLFYYLLTALFNVFPLPRQRDFQRSFAHAGEALDRGMHVLLFPEGTRSAEGKLAAFRPGIGLLVKQTSAGVLPMAIRGVGELKTNGRVWFRSGTVEVCIGEPMRFGPEESEAAIAGRLRDEVERLLEGGI